MVQGSVLVTVAVAGAATSGMLLSGAAESYVRERSRSSGMQRQAGTGSAIRRLLRGGVTPLVGAAALLKRARPLGSAFGRVSAVLRLKGFDCSPESAGSVLMSAALLLFAVGCAFGSWVAGVAFAVCSVVAASAWASHVLDQYRDSIREALPDAVRAMSACFHAGYTLQQTFDQLCRELPGPVGALFGSARDAMETGSTAKEALASLRGSGAVPELSFISVALEVQHRAGGSMRHVLDAACESLESELELRRSLRVHTAQARLSARVVTGVTIGLVGVLSLLTDDFLGPFFESALGLAMLAAAIAMQCAGVLIVRRMLKVEVD